MLPLASGPIAVIDMETTGLFPCRHDRVVEMAVVVMRRDGLIEREFVSLVNPERDIGPSSIHGLTSEDVLEAPRFEEVAGMLMEVLKGTVAVAAHNLRFDRQFLESEFSRIGYRFPDCFSICTLQLARGRKLADCCDDFGISLEGKAHSALYDARAAARLLAILLPESPGLVQQLIKLPPVEWPLLAVTRKPPLTRDESRHRKTEPPTFLQRLVGRLDGRCLPGASDEAEKAYLSLLDRFLEDRHVSDSEGDALVETAVHWGLSKDRIDLVHRNYLEELAAAAVADGTVTEAERRDLELVARLLGLGHPDLDERLTQAGAEVPTTPGVTHLTPTTDTTLEGIRVCFTGELQCHLAGKTISRELAEELARHAGLLVVDSVSRKLDLLVLADPLSQSGKAKKARQYGVRIMHEAVFWKTIGVDVE